VKRLIRMFGPIGTFVLLLGGPAFGAPPTEHPLARVVALADECLQRIDDEIFGYTCTLVKRERINGRLRSYEFAEMKLRHRRSQKGLVTVPFAVYMRFLKPAEMAGREVVLIEGRHHGQLIARRGGPRLPYMTMALDPRSDLAMRESRYPITDIGIRSMIDKLLEVGREDLDHDETELRYFEGAMVEGRRCTVMEVRHPVRRDHFRYHIARIFIDDDLLLPIRYASYDWPEEPDGDPRLVGEYTYLDLKLNVALTDRDFDYRNPAYGFRKDFRP